MITRRSFLIGSSAAFATISLSVFDKYFNFFETHGEPLIEAPDDPDASLCAIQDRGFLLGLNGHPGEWDCAGETWRDFLEFELGYDAPSKLSEFRHLYDKWGMKPTELDEEVPFWTMAAIMERRGPAADAKHLLEGLNIGPDLDANTDTVGGLTFYSVPSPIDNRYGVEADNAISLSLLQHRLNALGQNIAVSLQSW